MADETPIPGGDDCGGRCGSRKARNAAKDMDCAQLLEKINELTNREKPGRVGTKGLVQRFRDYRGDDATHGPAIIQQQNGLRAYMNEYERKGCGGPPPNAVEYVEKDLPAPASSSEEGLSTGEKVAIVGGAAAAGYVAYRAIRMIPSLFPPLWWTIPANAAVP